MDWDRAHEVGKEKVGRIDISQWGLHEKRYSSRFLRVLCTESQRLLAS